MGTGRRTAIPKALKETVLKEFNYLCAICGSNGPHLHHIDEDPSHNEASNLLPLCPNCHLRDQHNPTARIDSGRLSLFREYKDPAILHEKFYPLWKRVCYVLEVQNLDLESLQSKSEELLSFIRRLSMGEFYSDQIGKLVEFHSSLLAFNMNTPQEVFDRHTKEDTEKYRKVLGENSAQIMALTVELLRYQDWTNPKHPRV